MTRHQFDVKDPAEKISLPFDFSRDLGTETIDTGTIVVAIAVWNGTESPVTLAQWGLPTEDNGIVYVGVQAGLAAIDYDVTCQCDTTPGGRRLKIAGILPVRAV